FGVATEVVVGAVVDALELVPAEREFELDVRRRGGIVRAFVCGVVAELQLVARDPLLDMPGESRLFPLLVEARRLRCAREVLHLHLLELARAEDEVPRRDLVAEGLADLGDAERELLPAGL